MLDAMDDATILIRNVRVNLTGKSGEVTVAVSVGGDHFITGDTVFTVISAIEAPVEIVTDNDGVKSVNIAPRGGSGTATFTFKEGFPSAFMAEDGDEVRLQILNVPEKAKLTIGLAEAGSTFPRRLCARGRHHSRHCRCGLRRSGPGQYGQ